MPRFQPNQRKPETKPTSPRSLHAQAMRRKCYEARMLGFSYRQIAEQLDIHYSTVAEHVQKYLKELVQEDRDNLRWMMFHRLEAIQSDLLPEVSRRGKAAARNAEVMIKAMEREAALMDLDLSRQKDRGAGVPPTISIIISAHPADSEAQRILESAQRGDVIDGEVVGSARPALPAPAEGALLEA